jgi:predicted PolB exonuclease-like 3'-5' exonuclease
MKKPIEVRIKRTMRNLKESLAKENYLNAVFYVTLLSLEIQEAHGEQRGMNDKRSRKITGSS